MGPVVQLLDKTVFSVGFQQNDTTLALRTRIERLPDLGPMVAMLIEQERGGHGSHRSSELVFAEAEHRRQSSRPACSGCSARERLI